MFNTPRWVIVLAACLIANLFLLAPAAESDDTALVPGKDRLFQPERTLCFLNLYAAGTEAHPHDPSRIANVLKFLLWSKRGVGAVRDLDEVISVIRIRLDPERLQDHKLSAKDIRLGIQPTRMVRTDDWLEEAIGNVVQVKEHEFLLAWPIQQPEQYREIILRANRDGEILRLKNVGRVQLVSKPFDIGCDIDGQPAATLVLKQALGADAATAIAATTEKVKEILETSAPGVEFEVIPFENSNLIYAAVETAAGSTREETSGKCHELAALAKSIAEITSVTSLAGYEIGTESSAPNVGTCLLRLKPNHKLSAQQLIERLEEKCRALTFRTEFFEQPPTLTFVAHGGFSVRVRNKANAYREQRPGSMSEAFLDDLLNREDLARLFGFLASNYREWELVIDNDVAREKGVSIANALEDWAAGLGEGRAEEEFRRLAKKLSQASVENEHGEQVPYRLFMQFRNKLGVNELDE
jgi:multidrug efflux pump subunit AcrB